jgi:formate dehydrogenase major subunit
MDGGGNFRANFGVERDGVNLLAEDGSHSWARHHHRLPRVRPRAAQEAGLVGRPHRRREGQGRRQELEDRPSGGIIRVVMKNHGCHPFGNAKARAVVWNFPDAIPQHREPLYGTRPDLVAKYPTHDDKKAFWRLPTLYKTCRKRTWPTRCTRSSRSS